MDCTVSRLDHLSDAELLATAEGVRGRERAATMDLLRALVEIDRRGLHLAAGFASLYAYCTIRLGLSEHEAYLRMHAARTIRCYPAVLEMLTDGRLTLTAVTLVARHLTAENHCALLEAACHKNKRQVLELLAELYPQPAVPSSLSRIPVAASLVQGDAASEGARTQDAAGAPDPIPLVDAAHAAFARSAVTPLAPERYRLEVTISREAQEMLCRLQAMMRHSIPDGDPARIVERSLQLLLAEVERRQIAASQRHHRLTPCNSGSRYVPLKVRESVWERDGGQCAFVGLMGRCTERAALEFHHVVPYAEGGATTIDNLELRCRAHNAYEAELFYPPDPDEISEPHSRPVLTSQVEPEPGPAAEPGPGPGP